VCPRHLLVIYPSLDSTSLHLKFTLLILHRFSTEQLSTSFKGLGSAQPILLVPLRHSSTPFQEFRVFPRHLLVTRLSLHGATLHVNFRLPVFQRFSTKLSTYILQGARLCTFILLVSSLNNSAPFPQVLGVPTSAFLYSYFPLLVLFTSISATVYRSCRYSQFNYSLLPPHYLDPIARARSFCNLALHLSQIVPHLPTLFLNIDFTNHNLNTAPLRF
jgi:hypothetical protein